MAGFNRGGRGKRRGCGARQDLYLIESACWWVRNSIHRDLQDGIFRVNQKVYFTSRKGNDAVTSPRTDGGQNHAFSQGYARPIQAWTRPWFFLEHLDLYNSAVVALQDSTELDLATNTSFRLWDKRCIQDGGISTDTAMRALLMIMFQPHAKDLVHLSSTEANEMVQPFAFRTPSQIQDCTQPLQVPSFTDTRDALWRAAKSLHGGCMKST